ncbi:MAG: PilN domain-containing protein [bacterium]
MIKLNLLPPDEKKEIASRNALRRIIAFGSGTLFFIFIFLMLLGSVWLYLSIQLNSIGDLLAKAETNPESQSVQEIKKEVEGINSRLQYLNKLQGQENDYSEKLAKISELIPAGIILKNISATDKKISLQGNAASREALLLFEGALNTSPDFKNLDSPLSNFLKETDIEFTFMFEIK